MVSRRRRLDRLIGLALLCWSGSAWALEPAEADLQRLLPLSLDELIKLPVVTASRQEETRDQTPAHIVVVTREQIRERRYKNLANLLEDMPGVDFMRGTKSSQFNQFSVQGYTGPNKLVVMLDGVRIGHPAGGNFPVAENLSLYHAKQVEFLYGPAAALYGADAVAGVVNIITDHAGHREGGWAEVGAGNFGTGEASFMAGFMTAGGIGLNLGGHWQRSDRAPLQDYYPTEFAKVDAGGIAAADREDYVGDIASRSLYARLDVGDDLSFGFYRNVFRSLTSTGDPPATAIYLDDSRWITQTDTLYGKYRFTPSANLSGELVVDYSRMEVDPGAKYHNWYNGYTDGYSYVLGERLAVEQNINWRLDERHRVQAGLGYQKYYAIETASLPAPYDTGKDPEDQGYLYPNTDLPFQIYDAAFHNLSAYAQIQSEWNDRFSTMAGLRLDHHSEYGQTLNPRLGATWRAGDRHLFKALYGEAFRAPSPEEYLSSYGVFSGATNADGLYIGTSFRIPNFDLQPEKAKTLSLTWDWRPRQNLNVVANAYRSEIRNLIVTQPSTDTDAIPGAILVNPETKGNAGGQTQTGLDLMAQWRFKLGDDWTGDLWGSASWVEGEIDEGDGVDWEIPWVAEHKFKLGVTLRYRDRFTVTPRILMVGDTSNGRKKPSTLLTQQCTQTMVAPDRCMTDGYTVVNLHLGWHKLLDGNTSLWLDVYNLFDRRYHVAHGSASRTFYDMPQQPRSWVASLEYRF
ncbi:MAG: TonB-dependent receptor [Thiobacillus sp.]|nr:TonB-dependent receptor [Thiobacillus sp.]